ncbi:GNAT family N-acetyltransferase [Flavihumibacter sp. UBA7668]|uniref:GNAT family N-acetyltransferase n=1 Tax=Flavihumibacter sp. UBA7668 TaxID=1946542 RepID=UPI0025C3F465|nr:GNAT family N-acetyltransferase [Flavihumibacter sp. UBA7668]
MEWIIRPIQAGDNQELASIVRTALTEFGANKPGTVYYDDTTDHLFDLFQTAGSFYLIAEQDGKLLGGAGIFPTAGLPEGWCELVKMYLRKEARGKGLGKELIRRSLDRAKRIGYHTVYLETMPELRKAVSVYEQFGFVYLPAPVGASGHFGCDVWMKKSL